MHIFFLKVQRSSNLSSSGEKSICTWLKKGKTYTILFLKVILWLLKKCKKLREREKNFGFVGCKGCVNFSRHCDFLPGRKKKFKLKRYLFLAYYFVCTFHLGGDMYIIFIFILAVWGIQESWNILEWVHRNVEWFCRFVFSNWIQRLCHVESHWKIRKKLFSPQVKSAQGSGTRKRRKLVTFEYFLNSFCNVL